MRSSLFTCSLVTVHKTALGLSVNSVKQYKQPVSDRIAPLKN